MGTDLCERRVDERIIEHCDEKLVDDTGRSSVDLNGIVNSVWASQEKGTLQIERESDVPIAT